MRFPFSIQMTVLVALALLSLPVSAQTGTTIKEPHANLPCSSCHQTANSIPDKNTCLRCHTSYEKLAQRTEKLNPAFNPHNSHRGYENCTSCHSMHSNSSLMCNDCHGFKGSGTTMK